MLQLDRVRIRHSVYLIWGDRGDNTADIEWSLQCPQGGHAKETYDLVIVGRLEETVNFLSSEDRKLLLNSIKVSNILLQTCHLSAYLTPFAFSRKRSPRVPIESSTLFRARCPGHQIQRPPTPRRRLKSKPRRPVGSC
jgi:hypothetical protein